MHLCSWKKVLARRAAAQQHCGAKADLFQYLDEDQEQRGNGCSYDSPRSLRGQAPWRELQAQSLFNWCAVTRRLGGVTQRVSSPQVEVIMMMWGYGWGWGSWLGMGVAMILFWVLVIAAIVVLVSYLRGSRDARRSTLTDGLGRPEELLAERFARGEIDEQEYQRRRELLRGGR